jgi:HEAT repeat protein
MGGRALSDDFKDVIWQTAEKLSPELHTRVKNNLDYLLSTNISSYEDLLDLVQTSNADLKARVIACWILGRIQNKKAVKALLTGFEDQEISLQWEAAKSLASLSSKRAVKPLIKSLLEAHATEKRSAAAYALGWLQDSRAVDPLVQVLNSTHEDPRVRGLAAEALAQFKAPRIVDNLIKALKDKAPEVRFWSAYALGQIGNRRALPELEYLAQNDHTYVANWWKVSEEASEAIHNLNSPAKGRTGT